MVRTLSTFILVVTLLPAGAQAVPITFVYETDLPSPSADGLFGGSVTFDAGDVAPGNTVEASQFLDWEFTWGSDMSVSSQSGLSAFVPGFDTITFDATGGITSWELCVGTPGSFCTGAQTPAFYTDSQGTLMVSTSSATRMSYDAVQSFSRVAGETTGSTKIPEPVTLGLLALGIGGVAGRRKERPGQTAPD